MKKLSLGFVVFLFVSSFQVHAIVSQWTDNSGNWSNAANWSNGVPQNAGDEADFIGSLPFLTATVDIPVHFGTILFNETPPSGLIINSAGGNSLFADSGTSSPAFMNVFSGGGQTISAPIDLTNSSLVVNSLFFPTFSGVVSGSGSITKIGGGLLTIDTLLPNFYTGGTFIGTQTAVGGEIEIAADLDLGTGPITFGALGGALNTRVSFSSNKNITLNGEGTFDINPGVTTTLNGTIVGAGSLKLIAFGTLVLTGTNSYTGGTTVSGGTLEGNSNSLPGDIHNNSVVIFNQTFNGTYAGNMDGTGSLTKIGGATLILGGVNSYTGGTTVSNGILEGNTSSLQGNITNNATLTFNQNSPGTYSSSVTGTGAMIKTGSSSLLLPGNNTQPGGLTITNGSLIVDGTFSAAPVGILVQSGGILNGNGALNGNVNVFGTLGPGSSIGTLTVNGNVTFHPGSTFSVDVNGPLSDLLQVNGSVTIQPGSTLLINPEVVPTAPFSDPIIETTGGVSGTFTHVVDTLPFLEIVPVYTPLEVLLQFNILPLFDFVSTGNAGRTALYLDRQNPVPGTDFFSVFSALASLPNEAALTQALNQLHPALFNAFVLTQENTTTRYRTMLSDRLDGLFFETCGNCCVKPCQEGAWISLLGDLMHQGDTFDQFGFDAESGQIAIGFDHSICRNYIAGASLGYSYADIDWNTNTNAHGQTNSYIGSLYSSASFNSLLIDASILGAYSRSDAERHIFFNTTIDREASHHHNSWLWDAHLGVLYPFTFCSSFVLSPFAEIDYFDLHQSGFRETGADSINLIVDEHNANMIRFEGGLQYSSYFIEWGCRWIPTLSASCVQEWRNRGTRIISQMEGGVGTFSVVGYNPDRTLFSPAIEVMILPACNDLSFTLRYEGEFGRHMWDQNFLFNVSYGF